MSRTNGISAEGLAADPRAPLPSGYCLINGQNGREYRILKKLGGGGFGITYEATDPEGRRVAVKEFFPLGLTVRGAGYLVVVTGDADAVQSRLRSFSKETDLLISVKGLPSVVEIYDFFQANQTAYYVMEYIDGLTMLSFMKQFGLMKPEQTEAEFVKLMHSIDVLHGHGIIHRDISPDNIMIRNDGSFKLIDFGSARSYAGAQNLTINIKESFAPLEQYSETGQGRFTDVYSLAATMYYAYTGKLIPLGQSAEKRESELTLALMNAGLNVQQINVLKKALSTKPANRYQSMKQFAEAYCSTRTKQDPTLSQPVARQAEEEVRGSRLKDRIGTSIALLRERPGYPVTSGALCAIALVLQFLL